VLNDSASIARRLRHSTESPILMPLFGQKTGVRARNAGMNEIKSGIQCSALISVAQQSATSPRFDAISILDYSSTNHNSRFEYLTNCPKWRLHQNGY
jgi:hypothetical protein